MFTSNLTWRETIYYYIWRVQNAAEQLLELVKDKYAILKYYLFLGYVPHCVYFFKEVGRTYTYCNDDNILSIIPLCFTRFILQKDLNLITMNNVSNVRAMGCPSIVLYKTYNRDQDTTQIYETYHAYDQASGKTFSLKVDDHGTVHHMKRPKPIAFLTSKKDSSRTEDISLEYGSVGSLLSKLENVTAKEFVTIAKEFFGDSSSLRYVNVRREFSEFILNIITMSNELVVYKDSDII